LVEGEWRVGGGKVVAHTGEGAGATASRPVVTGKELPRLQKTRLSSVKPVARRERAMHSQKTYWVGSLWDRLA